MLRSSISIGRFFGVELRLHISFPILLLLAIVYSEMTTHAALRGVALWVALCFAVGVREVARSIAATYVGMRLLALFLLPVGGVIAFAPRDRGVHGKTMDTRAISAAGPIANFAFGLLILAAAYAIDPHVSLLAQPWIGTAHILRSFVWLQLLLGAVSLLPASAMPSRQLLRMKPPADGGQHEPAPRSNLPAFSLATAAALSMILLGVLLMTLWPVILGAFMLLYAQLSTQTMASPEAEAILVRDVMLTEYTLLSTTDTLRDALSRTVHSLQDVFPVVRGNRLVGSITRQTIAARLLAEGDTYLQGLMTRTLQIATPSERLVEALRRSANLGASEFIPVVEEGAMLGILTPQSLTRAVQQLQLTRPQPAPQEQP